MLRRFFINIVLISSLAGFIFLGAWLSFLLSSLVSEPAGIRYELHPGTSFKTLSENLYDQGLIKHPLFFNLLARLQGKTQSLKAGIYLIPRGTTPIRLLKQFTSGKGLLYHAFTIIPGWTFQQLRTAMVYNSFLHSTIQNKSDSEVMKLVAAIQLSPEGQFFPDTYYYLEGTSDVKLLTLAWKRMQKKLQEAWLKKDFKLSFKTTYEVLIAASIVEKESHWSSERPLIAGVLINRLQKNMPLQCDPTVSYGLYQWELSHPNLGFSGMIRKQDLRMNTPYNTYLHKGLPPTPIAIPSMDALQAVLHPIWHHYFYFVATGGGGHQFSNTLEEQHLAVKMLRFHEQGFFNSLFIRAYLLKRLSFKTVFPIAGWSEDQTDVLQ